MEIRPLKGFDRRIVCRPDKSVTHRAVMFNCLADDGSARITRPLLGEDCLSTVECMRRLGAQIEVSNDEIFIRRGGVRNGAQLYVGNSGTTMRLLCGALAPYENLSFSLDGDASIRKRPMNRVIAPLTAMGACISGENGLPPLHVTGAKLRGIVYDMPVASAQVKSAVLLAGLKADGETVVKERVKSRDHTERMLAAMGADIAVRGDEIRIRASRLAAADVEVCGDVSSAAYAMALAAGVRGGKVVVENVGVNPTRTGILDVLKDMGVQVEYENYRDKAEPVADVCVRARGLKPVVVGGDIIPRLIDEIPIIAVLMCLCEGESVIRDAAELKVKESNRIRTTADALRRLGADVRETDDGMVVRGFGYLPGGGVADACGDHRIAMAMSVAAALSRKGGSIAGGEVCAVSYPGFFEELF